MQKRMAVVVLSRLKIKAILLQCIPIHKCGKLSMVLPVGEGSGIHVQLG